MDAGCRIFNHSSNFDINLLKDHYTKHAITRARAREVFGISELSNRRGFLGY